MLQPDSSLGPYRLISRIGAGGMGEVWKAEDTRLGRTVAIKVLPARVATDAEATARMKREARTAAQLYHNSIATIHSIEQEGDRLFIVMEYVEGEPLTTLIRRGGLSESDICRIGRGVADALAEAHAKGIVHRDIKPDNIIVNGSRVKVLDFGIAKQVGVVAVSSDAPTAFETQQGMVIGTVHYMSPEQALGKKLDARTDIFSLGVVLYEAATGQRPFRGETVTETMTQIIRDEPPPPAQINPGISPGLNAIITRCLRKSPDERFATADELRGALDRRQASAPTEPYTAGPTLVTTAPAPRRTRWPLIAIIAFPLLFLGIATSYYFVHQPVPQPQPAPVATVTVTAAPPVIPSVSEGPVREGGAQPEPKKPQPEPQPQPQPAPPPPEKPNLPRKDYEHGMRALENRNFPVARDRLGAALADGHLDEREQALAQLGLAIATFRRVEAAAMARDVKARWPDDPDLARLEQAFAFGVRRRGRRF